MFSRARKYWSRRSDTSKEENLIDIFKPLYILLLLLGLFPCSVTFPKGKYSKIEQKSVVINAICALIMIVIIGGYVATNFNDKLSKSISLSNVNLMIEIVLYIACTLVGYYCIYFYKDIHLNMLIEVTLTWSELAHNDSTHKILKRFRFLIWVLILGWTLVLVVGYIILSYFKESRVWLWMIVAVIVPEMVPSGIVAFYNAMGLMVACLLKNIERQCGQLADNNKFSISKSGFVKVKPEQYRMTVSQLELAYKKTLEMKRELNVAFQAILLIITLQTFHTILCEAHLFYRGMVKTGSWQPMDIVESVHWMLYQTLKMYAISYPGIMIENEEKQIGQTLLRIPAESVQMFRAVQHFSSVMTYQETQMTAYGYFELDANLVINTLAAVATYLMILVQFDSSD